MHEFSIVVPAFNEEENLPVLVKRIAEKRKRYRWDCELLIVDDNSSDRTGAIADGFSRKSSWIRVLHRKKGKNGMGYALREGTARSKGEIIVWTMADLSDDLDVINDFLALIRDGGYDIVVGSRYIRGGSPGDNYRYKAFASFAFTTLSRIMFGIPVHDVTNAYRAFKKEVASLRVDSGD